MWDATWGIHRTPGRWLRPCAATVWRCALTTFGNLLDADRAARERIRATVRATIDAAIATGVGIVVTFPGRDEGAAEEDNYRQLAVYYAPLVEHAARGNVKIAIENWPGP